MTSTLNYNTHNSLLQNPIQNQLNQSYIFKPHFLMFILILFFS